MNKLLKEVILFEIIEYVNDLLPINLNKQPFK